MTGGISNVILKKILLENSENGALRNDIFFRFGNNFLLLLLCSAHGYSSSFPFSSSVCSSLVGTLDDNDASFQIDEIGSKKQYILVTLFLWLKQLLR